MLVMAGPGSPGRDTASLGGTALSFLFLTKGEAPEPKVEGARIVVGEQTVALEGGNLVLGKIAAPWKPADR
jgi:hypothetical protein